MLLAWPVRGHGADYGPASNAIVCRMRIKGVLFWALSTGFVSALVGESCSRPPTLPLPLRPCGIARLISTTMLLFLCMIVCVCVCRVYPRG